MDHQESIWIGPEKYIQWHEFDPQTQSIYEIDERVSFQKLYDKQDALSQFWKKTETECGVDCCGIDALRFWPDDIARATQNLDIVVLLNQFRDLKDGVARSHEQVVVYHRLNQLFHKTTFLVLIDYLINEVECIYEANL
ncbi:hypothetical protein GCM10027592_27920 [Spirosoma flavus]